MKTTTGTHHSTGKAWAEVRTESGIFTAWAQTEKAALRKAIRIATSTR
jgi:hypothetical protein